MFASRRRGFKFLKQNIELQQRSYEIALARWNAGMVTELDVKQAESFLLSTRSRLPVLENELRLSKNALGVLLATTPDLVDEFFVQNAEIPDISQNLAVGIPAQLLCRRPDVKRALHIAAAQSARIGIAVSDLLPRISVNGFIGFEASTSFRKQPGANGHLFDAKSLTYFFGPSIAWPILNYGRLKNRVRVEYTRYYQAVLDYQQTVFKAYQEVEDGLSRFVQAHLEVDLLEESVKAVERAASLARTQYVEGIADYLRVLDTERSKLDEEEILIIAKGKIALSIVSVYRALGGGWESMMQQDCEEQCTKKLSDPDPSISGQNPMESEKIPLSS